MAINNHRIFLYKPEAASVTAYNAGPYLLGELIVDNLNVSIKLQEISTVTFTVPRIINNTANTRIDEVLDSYIIELWYGDLSGTLDTDYYKYRFTLYSTPINFSDNKIIHSYTGYSLEALTELKMLVSWPGIEISDFFRKVSYNNTTDTPKFLEAKSASAGGGNFEYTITTSGSGADYITLTPTTAEATDIDIFIYEVRQRLSGASVVSESEAGLIPYSGTGPNDAGFKAGYYFLTISGGYVTQISIALPENYTDFNDESVNSNLLFFKLYDNPLSRRYAIGITTNAEEANDMYMDLAHDAALGVATDFDDFNFQTQKFYSKNGLTLKQVLLGKENTTVNSITEDGLLYSTGLTLGTIDNSLNAKYRSNLEFNNVSRYAAIKTLAESFDAIPVYDTVNNTVSFYPENIYGVNNGLIIRYGAYLKALNKEIDASKIITNAIGLGKDNLTISLVNPTGENYWEDYSYYLDDYYIESPSEIGTITEDANLGITFNYVSTSGYASRWMSVALAEKLGKWQYTRDWFHSILTGEYNPSGFSSTITQFYNFYELRLEAIRSLIKKETEYFTALKKEVKYEAFKNYYDKLSKDNPNTFYSDKLLRYTNSLTTAREGNEALLVILNAARNAIFDENTAGSYAAKMVVLRGFLQKDSVTRAINLDNLRPFQRETVVNDSSIDDEKDLLEIVKTHVDENKEPKVTISIDVASILAAQEAQEDWKKVKVGDKINIYLDELNVDVVAQIREINVDFEGHSLSFVISTVRNYNKGFGNFVLKTIRNLYNSNNNNVQYEIDGNRYSRETAGNVNFVLENGFNTADTNVNSGLEDDNGNPSTTIDGAGTVTSSIGSVDDLTESVSSYVSRDTQGVIIADGRVLAYHNYTSPTTYSSEIEMSAETGFTIRKIAGGTITKQVYIDTEGNAVFSGKLQVGTGAPQTIDEVFDNIEDQIDAGTIVYRANDSDSLTTATNSANTNDILLITGTFTASSETYVKDDIYKFNGSVFVLDLDLKTKITGSVGGWTINATDIKANNNKMTLHSDSDDSGRNPYISIGQTSEAYNQDGAFMGIVGETGSGNGVARLSLKNGSNGLFWDGINLNINGGGTFSGALQAATGSFTGSIKIGSGESVFKADTDGIYLGSEDFNSAEFKVTPAGALTATGANITGAITATSGSFTGAITSISGNIGGFIIGETSLTAGSGSTSVGISTGAVSFFAGNATPGSAPFRVTNAGVINATSGQVGPLSLSNINSASTISFDSNNYTGSGTINIISDSSSFSSSRTFTFINTPEINVNPFNISNFSVSYTTSGSYSSGYWTLFAYVRYGTNIIKTYSRQSGPGTFIWSVTDVNTVATNIQLVLTKSGGIPLTFTVTNLTGVRFLPSMSLENFAIYSNGNTFSNLFQTKNLTLINNNIETENTFLNLKITPTPIGGGGVSVLHTETTRDGIIIQPNINFGTSSRRITLSTPSLALTANRTIRFPDDSGTIALQGGLIAAYQNVGFNSYTSPFSISSYRYILVQGWVHNSVTTKRLDTWIDLNDTNQLSSTNNQERFHRYVWDTGAGTFANTFYTRRDSSTTMSVKTDAGGGTLNQWNWRITGWK